MELINIGNYLVNVDAIDCIEMSDRFGPGEINTITTLRNGIRIEAKEKAGEIQERINLAAQSMRNK